MSAGIDFDFDETGEVKETIKSAAVVDPSCHSFKCDELINYSSSELYEQKICNVSWLSIYDMDVCPKCTWYKGD